MDVQDFVESLQHSTRVDVGEFVGCSAQEVDAIEQAAGFKLPGAYLELMSVLGRFGGGFMWDTSLFFPHVIEMNPKVQKMHQPVFDAMPKAFVFLNDPHAGYFLCFLDNHPAVYGLAEVNGRLIDRLEVKHESFEDFLEASSQFYLRRIGRSN